MKLENQVTSLEISKKLKELGVKQESYFTYVWHSKDEFILLNDIDFSDWEQRDKYSAYTSDELMDMLPYSVKNYKFQITKSLLGGHYVSYTCKYAYTCSKDEKDCDLFKNNRICWIDMDKQKLSDALGKMLIYLIENNLMEVK